MGFRETYLRLFPVFFLIFLLTSAISLKAQESILEREINLPGTTGEIDLLLKEISRKGKFSFTYTSQIQVHRMASVLERKQSVRNHLEDIFRYDSIQFIEQNNKILLVPTHKKIVPVYDYRIVKGLVIDGKTRRPLPYTSVFLMNQSAGTITNASGRFEFKVSPGDFTDTLGASFIGYRLYKISLATIDTGTLIIRMASEKVLIRAVTVKPLDPIYILTKAIEQISVNFDKRPALLTAFFRETTRQDNKNISLSEAVINIFKEPYISLRNDQVKIFKGRKGANIDEKEHIDFVVQGGLYYTLQLDIVKNLPTFLDADYFALYEYNLETVISHFDRPTYVISFDQREGVKYPCYKGRVYVDVDSKAIVGATFAMSEKGMSYATGIYVKKTPKRIGVRPVSAKYEVYYRNYHGKWNLSNARSEILMRVKRKKNKQQDKFNSEFASTSEFVVTNKDTSNISRFKFAEVSKPKDVLVEQIGEPDEEFWGSENIITPDEPIEKAIIRLGRRNSLLTDAEIAAIKIEEDKEAARVSTKESTDDEDDEDNSQD